MLSNQEMLQKKPTFQAHKAKEKNKTMHPSESTLGTTLAQMCLSVFLKLPFLCSICYTHAHTHTCKELFCTQTQFYLPRTSMCAVSGTKRF